MSEQQIANILSEISQIPVTTRADVSLPALRDLASRLPEGFSLFVGFPVELSGPRSQPLGLEFDGGAVVIQRNGVEFEVASAALSLATGGAGISPGIEVGILRGNGRDALGVSVGVEATFSSGRGFGLTLPARSEALQAARDTVVEIGTHLNNGDFSSAASAFNNLPEGTIGFLKQADGPGVGGEVTVSIDEQFVRELVSARGDRPGVEFDSIEDLFQQLEDAIERLAAQCFLAGTPITMADGTVKPIEEIAPGDWVQSYDENGDLTPGRVTRTFQNRSKYILDVFGLMVTPGHATYCADGPFDGRHVPMIDILRSDGALMREDGTKVRAATGCDLGSPEDQMIVAITGDKLDNGQVTIRDQGMIRAGTRFIMDDGTDISVLQLIEGAGASISDDGMVMVEQDDTTVSMPFHWRFTDTLPKPEDYVLQRSQVTLAEIYTEGDWEAIGPQLAAPLSGEHGAAITRGPASTDTAPPNIPLSMRGSQDQPTMTRAQRRAYEARERKAEKRQTIVN